MQLRIAGGTRGAEAKVLEIDYERYAHAQATPAWLDLRLTLDLCTPLAPAALVGPFRSARPGVDRDRNCLSAPEDD
jgi:hypothetical protein